MKWRKHYFSNKSAGLPKSAKGSRESQYKHYYDLRDDNKYYCKVKGCTKSFKKAKDGCTAGIKYHLKADHKDLYDKCNEAKQLEKKTTLGAKEYEITMLRKELQEQKEIVKDYEKKFTKILAQIPEKFFEESDWGFF